MRTLLIPIFSAAVFASAYAQQPADVPRTSYTKAVANPAGAGKPGEWTSQARDFANTRFSPLDQINASNVGNLKLAWSFSDGTQYGHEGGPLIVGDTMYLVTPLSEYCLRAGPHQARSLRQMVVLSKSLADYHRQGLLRCRASRLGLC